MDDLIFTPSSGLRYLSNRMTPDHLFMRSLYTLKERLGAYREKEFVRFLMEPMLKAPVVCEEKKFVYMKIARTGGTSIYRDYFQERLGLQTLNNRDDLFRLMLWIEGLTRKKWDGYFKFAFVRNPWDRMVSLYFYFTKLGRISCPFRDFVINLSHYVRTVPECALHAMPSSCQTHLDGKPCVDLIGRYENLQDDFNAVCGRLGTPEMELPVSAATDHDNYTAYFDDETRGIVAELYSEDIRLFGYEFK